MVNRTRLILSGVGLFIVLIILAVGVLTIGRQVTFQNRASSDAGSATFSITPNTGTHNVSEIFPITLSFDTVGATNGVSMVVFDFSIPNGLDMVDASGNPITQLPLNTAVLGSNWNFTVNSVTRSAGVANVQVSGTYNNTAGYTATTPVVLANTYLKAITAGTQALTFNGDNSMILTKSFPTTDIMKTPVATSFTVNATTPGVGHLIFSPASGTLNTGTVNKVDVSFNTGGVAISSLSFRLTYPHTGTTPVVDVVDSTGTQATAITPDTTLLGSTEWTFPVKSVTRSNNVVTIDFAAVNSNIAGFTPTTDTKVATFYLRANSIPTTNPVVMSFIPAQTTMLSKANATEILQQPTSLSYTINTATDTIAPTVNLTAPAAGNVLGTVNMTAAATDNVGVTRVEFYSGTTLLGTSTSSPYSYAWNTTSVSNGSYSLTAKAFDAAGNSGTSTAVSVTVNNTDTTAPTVSLTAPATGNVSGTVNITATATDNSGTVSRVEFYAGSTLLNSDTTSPYGYAWNTTTVANSTYTLTAKAYDAAGNSATSAQVNVNVNNTSTPSVSFGFKVQGVTSALTKTFSVTARGLVTATVTASLTSDASGVFRTTTPITLTGISVGNPGTAYDILIKGPNTLAKKLGTITLVSGTNTAPTSWESVTAVLGDFDTSGTTGYNVMNISDIAKMLQNFTALSTTVTTANGLVLYDVDNDGSYALRDIATILGNYIILTTYGD